ncbi:MAG: response regulator [Anaerolineales bacterium]|jgi:CheY-like chemotaxis protein
MPRVMIVDDDETMQSLLRTLLQIEGYEVIEAPSFDQIIATAHSQRPDAVLMDCILPDVDGIELLRQMRSDEALEETVFVMTSGLDYEESSMARGANAFLQKPYPPEQLIEVLQREIEKAGGAAPPGANFERS